MQRGVCPIILILLAACVCRGNYDWSTNPGTGDPNTPYQVSTVEQLLAIGSSPDLLSRCFVLTADLDLEGRSFASAPLAPDTDPASSGFQGAGFSGSFDGDGHTIGNLQILTEPGQSAQSYLGLFGSLSNGGKVSNVNLTCVRVEGDSFVGALAGLANTAEVDNCRCQGTVGGNSWTGGLIGTVESAALRRCRTDTITTGYIYTGGLIGSCSSSEVTSCSTAGSVTASYWTGGLTGYNQDSRVASCFSTCDVSGDSYVGGLAGKNARSSAADPNVRICNSYASGQVIGPVGGNYIGGFTGQDTDGIFSCCYASATVTAAGTTVGAFLGTGSANTAIEACYFLSTAGTANGYAAALTDEQLKQRASFAGWDFLGESANEGGEPWRMCLDGVGYPLLSWQYAFTGDVACPDGTDMEDAAAFSQAWMTTAGEPRFNPLCDLNADGAIDLADLSAFCSFWLNGL